MNNDAFQEWLLARSRHLAILSGTISAIRKMVDDGDIADDPSLLRLFDKLDQMDRELAPLEARVRAEAPQQERSGPHFNLPAEGSDRELRSMFPRSL